jgi:P27 family predicted phage terminase small subunit
MIHKPPEILDAQARAKWAELLPILETRGEVDTSTLDALAAYCQAWSRWQSAEGQVNALGAVVKSPAGFPVQNPYLAVAAAAQRQMRQWADVLGLHKRPGRRKAADDTEADQGNSLLKLLGGTTNNVSTPKGRTRTA